MDMQQRVIEALRVSRDRQGCLIGDIFTDEEMGDIFKVVLREMRDPSESMLDASWRAAGESKEMRARTHAHYKRHWAAMVDAALGEAGGC